MNSDPKSPIARIPIGSILKMLGGEFHVTNAEATSLTLRGPINKLKRGMVLMLFGVTAQVTLLGRAVAVLRARHGRFDTRRILRLEPEHPTPEKEGEIHKEPRKTGGCHQSAQTPEKEGEIHKEPRKTGGCHQSAQTPEKEGEIHKEPRKTGGCHQSAQTPEKEGEIHKEPRKTGGCHQSAQTPEKEGEMGPRCKGCGGAIISQLCTCGTPHPDYKA